MKKKTRKKKDSAPRGRIPLLFVGLDNPQSADPRYALFPRPKGCSGHRLYVMMNAAFPDLTMGEYVGIPKTNLFPVGMAPRIQKTAMMRGAAKILIEQLRDQGTRVVMMGKDVATAVQDAYEGAGEHDRMKFAEFYEMHGSFYSWIPHPSGRNHIYNDVRNKRLVGKFLVDALLESKKQ